MDQNSLLREVAEDMLIQESGKRRFIYTDVEELIESNFLTHPIRVGDSTILLRTLLPEESKRLRSRILQIRTSGDVSRWVLASSTWMVDGLEMSMDPKDNAPWHLYQELYRDMPDSLIAVLASAVSGLQNRLNRATRLVEAYCYEGYSRSSWRLSGREVAQNSNIVKRLWGAYNTTEDLAHAEDMQWRYTQTIVSSMTSKGGKEIGNSLDKTLEKEKARQRKVIEDAVNWVIQGDKATQPKIKVIVDGKEFAVDRIQIAETFEELEEDMRRSFAGEQDYHDARVSKHDQEIRDRTEAARAERASRLAEARSARERAFDEGVATITPLVGYTEEQLRAIRPDVLDQKSVSVVDSSGEARTTIYERYFGQKIRHGVIDNFGHVKPSDLKTPAQSEPALPDILEARKPTLK